MSNDYFNSSGAPTYGSRGLSQVMDAQFDAVGVGFDRLPNMATLYGGKSNYAVDTGTSGALAVAISTNITALADGLEVVVKTAFACPGASTITVTGSTSLGAKSILRSDGTALLANDWAAGDFLQLRYNGSTGVFQMERQVSTSPTSGLPTTGGTMTGPINEAKGADIASAATINLTTATGNFVHVTGTTNITAITIPIGAQRTVIFDGPLTLTHSASLLLPNAVNITTAANDRMVVRGDTAGAIVISYTKTTGYPNTQPIGLLKSDGTTASYGPDLTGFALNEVKGADIASAGTINLTTATGNLVHVTGTTTITGITIPSGAERTMVFDGALTLTHNATTLILPTGASIVTAAGDIAVVRGDGSGNARVISYQRASGQPLLGGIFVLYSAVPTAAATLDALNVFTSAYDEYEITLEGYKPSADDTLLIRFANAGTADAGSNYLASTLDPGSSYTTTATSITSAMAIYSSGLGGCIRIRITNANDATNLKCWEFYSQGQVAVTPAYLNTARAGVYKGGAISGIRLLWTGAANFSAQGRLMIRGIRNS